MTRECLEEMPLGLPHRCTIQVTDEEIARKFFVTKLISNFSQVPAFYIG